MEFVEVIDIERTADVKSSGNFASLMLARSSVDALTKAGFIYPSPVQAAAIPIGLMGFGSSSFAFAQIMQKFPRERH